MGRIRKTTVVAPAGVPRPRSRGLFSFFRRCSSSSRARLRSAPAGDLPSNSTPIGANNNSLREVHSAPSSQQFPASGNVQSQELQPQMSPTVKQSSESLIKDNPQNSVQSGIVPTSTTPTSSNAAQATREGAAASSASTPQLHRCKGTILADNAKAMFLIEEADGASPETVDAALLDALGDNVMVAHLRSAQWADRVLGIQELQAHFEARAAHVSALQRERMFIAVVSVLAHLLKDKLVPVFLPSLELLQCIFSPSLLDGLKPQLLQNATHVLAPQLVSRAGSSNPRAREESANALMHLATTEQAAPVGPHLVRPLANRKAAHAAVGRLECLHTLVLRLGFGRKSGVSLTDALAFALPFHQSASDKIRETAHKVLHEALSVCPVATVKWVSEREPNLARALRKRAGLEEHDEQASAAAASHHQVRKPLQLRQIPNEMISNEIVEFNCNSEGGQQKGKTRFRPELRVEVGRRHEQPAVEVLRTKGLECEDDSNRKTPTLPTKRQAVGAKRLLELDAMVDACKGFDEQLKLEAADTWDTTTVLTQRSLCSLREEAIKA